MCLQAVCVEDGAHLVSITSPYENAFVHGILGWYDDRMQQHYKLWIGLNNKQVNLLSI